MGRAVNPHCAGRHLAGFFREDEKPRQIFLTSHSPRAIIPPNTFETFQVFGHFGPSLDRHLVHHREAIMPAASRKLRRSVPMIERLDS
jgi:hypothetical protein